MSESSDSAGQRRRSSEPRSSTNARRWTVALPVLAAIFSLLPFYGSIRVARASEMLAVGATFPAWQLADHSGAERSSDEMTGKKYLVWFYPKAMTPGCTAEGRGLREAFADFQAIGMAVFGISADDPAANAAFVEAESFPFPLLSDPELTLASKVGADGMLGYTRRISYVIGTDGKVAKAYADVDPAGHAEQVLRDIAPAEAPD